MRIDVLRFALSRPYAFLNVEIEFVECHPVGKGMHRRELHPGDNRQPCIIQEVRAHLIEDRFCCIACDQTPLKFLNA